METLIPLISSFPTVIYTVPLIICLILWFFSLLGIFDFDAFDADIDADAGLSGLLATFGLAGVPITLSSSLLFLFAWASSLFSSAWLLPLIRNYQLWLTASIFVVLCSFILAVFITGKITKPLSKIFIVHEARSNRSLVSKTCVITSMRVDQNFGQAKVEDGGAGLIISVRSEQPNQLTKGDHALIYEYDAGKNIYFIIEQD